MIGGAAAAALVAGLGYSVLGVDRSSEPIAPARTVTAPQDAPLVDTTWRLVAVQRGETRLLARPNIDTTMRLEPDGEFLIKSCNNVFGQSRINGATVLLDGASNTTWSCDATAEAVGKAVHEVAVGWLSWRVEGNRLWLSGPGPTLEFRVKDSGQPPVSATEIVAIQTGPVRCRAVAGGVGDGLRIYALSNAELGGPWRLLPTGPVAPGEGPLLSRQLEQRRSGIACVVGFAPPGTAQVVYRSAPGAGLVPLDLRPVPGTDVPAYSGVIVRRSTGEIAALDAQGTTLQSWPTGR